MRGLRWPAPRPVPTIPLVLLAIALGWPAWAPGTDAFGARDVVRPGRPTPAPDFEVPTLGSGALRLSDFTGKVVLVNFWATWCPPCKREMPSIEPLYRRHRARGFAVLAISLDSADAATVARFVESLGLPFTVGLDPQMAVAQRYAVRGLPSTFLIDRTGSIVGVALGPRDFDSPPAHALVERLLE
jgi:peroxiredoxin